MTGATELAIRETERALAAAEAVVAEVRARHAEELRPFLDEVRQIKTAIRVLKGQKRTARVQAGPKAIGVVMAQFASGPVTQKEIVERSGLNQGTVSVAIRALVDEGAIVETGEARAGSREFRLKSDVKRVA